MTYLYVLRLLDSLLHRCERLTGWWTLTDWRGRLAFRQIDYAKRVQKASGWEPVAVTTRRSPWVWTPPTNATTLTVPGATATITYRNG